MFISVIDEHMEKTDDYEKRGAEAYRIFRIPINLTGLLFGNQFHGY